MAKTPASKTKKPPELSTYIHPETRLNNPPVGLVNSHSDGVEEKQTWAYDPHIDPALQFDTGRAQLEQLIDAALASNDPEQYRGALEELKRLAQPYLNWTGKAEKTSFDVETVSLHVHERMDPLTILKAVQRELPQDVPRQDDLFESPFKPEPRRQAIEFYQHEKGWANRLIAGDSLLVMNSLLQKESMAGKVQMIYLDPPYGIKYGSNFQPFVNKRDVKDRDDEDLTREPETLKAFRDTWELGIHSYLTYLRDRLFLARDLLHESGSVFVQIGDENVHLVRSLLDEVFGRENFCNQISYVTTTTASGNLLSKVNDFIIWYAKDKNIVKYRNLYIEKKLSDVAQGSYEWYEDKNKSRFRFSDAGNLPVGVKFYTLDNITSSRPAQKGDTLHFDFEGIRYTPSKGTFKSNHKGLTQLKNARRLQTIGNTLRYVRFFDDFPVSPVSNVWTDTTIAGFGDPKFYVVQTTPKVSQRCLLMTTDPGDLVLDPTCGSGTTAYVAEKWGRRWITCDTSRIALTLAKQRLLTGLYNYYPLRYPEQGVKGGFLYKTVPHITLKSIANNEEIDVIYEQEHPKIVAALAALNQAQDSVLAEWEVPFNFPDDWPEAARQPFDEFHTARRAMQQKMDASIQARADIEVLYDQPEIDKQRQRVTGPFTVEAVPFPTVLSLEEAQQPAQATTAVARAGESARHHEWLDELRKTGIRGKDKQHLKFADLETLPGAHAIQAIGTTAETGERVAISFGPPHAALEPRQVDLALQEAETLHPSPRLIVFAAFAFDPEAAKDIDETKWPGVTVLKAQMNADLQTEDLKKKNRSSESFWLVGQPDVELRQRADGLYEVEVHGFDYFDTANGELCSGGRDKIAVWLLDTDYDGRSLFPRQVFLPMADQKGGWNRIARNLKAVLDHSRLDAYSGTLSLPFAAGDNRRIAVKLVDDRGIESLKVIPLI
ncbi:MAG: adenine-specific DNA-methyltransferase [Pseudomonadota bacterium]|nr:adenine-specific DNA-methyltransferase [Pseudomonadota bacterium]